MKRNNGLYITLCAVLLVLLFLPLLQQLTGWVKVKKLNGAVVEVEQPKLTFESYKEQSFQGQLEQYAAAHFGFHEPIIRVYNQYLWSCYRKTYAADVIVGKDKWLYGGMQLRDHYQQAAYDYASDNKALVQKLEKDLDLLKKVLRLLDEQGTKLFFLICPNKDDVYPEHHPKHGYVMGDGVRAVDYYTIAFAENGINYLDVNAWFQQIKDTVSYPLFTHSGMHWSNIACAYASDSIFRYMEKLTGKNMPDLSYGSKYGADPRSPDRDLERCMNLLWKIKPLDYYYVPVKVVPDSTAQKLNLITVGDSFFWNMTYTLPMDKIFESYRYWYYFSSVFFDPNHDHVSQLNLKKELQQADVVMISLCTTQMYDINRGFLSQTLIQLSNDPAYLDARINAAVERIKNVMRNTPEWYESLQEKAVKRGKDLEQLMNDEARYLIDQNPERFL